MRSIIIVIIIALIVYFSGIFTEQHRPPVVRQTAPAHEEVVPKPEPIDTETEVWPYMEESGDAGLADNLMAKNFVLIYDGSGSMGDVDCSGGLRKFEVARRAVSDWAMSLPADANLGLVSFHQEWTVLDLAPGQRETFAKTVDAIYPGGTTPLTTAFKQAFSMLTRQGQSQLGYGEYTIVVITDGAADKIPDLSGFVDAVLRETPIQVYTIGFCIGEHHTLNQPGRTIYKAANNPEELRQGLKEALAEAEDFDVSDF